MDGRAKAFTPVFAGYARHDEPELDAGRAMSDIANLEQQILADIAAAADEAALEAVRVAALGRNGYGLRAAQDARRA